MFFLIKYIIWAGLNTTVSFGQTVSSTPLTNPKKGFFSVMSGTMKSGLPITTSSAFIDRILYPRFGESLISVSRYCGDGDVDRYYSSNPDEDFGRNAKEVKLVMGYWIQEYPEGSAPAESTVPAKSTWFAMAYDDKLKVNEGSVSKLTQVFSQLDTESPVATVKKTYLEIFRWAKKYSDPKKKFRIYSAAMICHDYIGNNPAAIFPKSVDILKTLVDSSDPSSTNPLNGKLQLILDRFTKVPRVSVEYTSTKGLEISYNKVSAKPLKNTYLVDLDAFKNAVYPGASSTVAAYKTSVGNGLAAKLESLLASCENGSLKNPIKKYWFEPFAMEILCHYVKGALKDQTPNLVSRIKLDGVSSTEMLASHLTQSNFNLLIKEAMDFLFIMATLETTQDLMNTDSVNFPPNDSRCFEGSSIATERYLNKILASVVIPFESDLSVIGSEKYKMVKVGEMSMPEPNYALGAAHQYYNNRFAIAMNLKDQFLPSVGIEFSSVTDITTSKIDTKSAPMSINFHLRDKQCHDGPFYCQNETALNRDGVL